MAHHNSTEDDDTVGGSTWASMSLAISDEGTCPKHPHIKLRETGADGFVYQKESCPECDNEFQSQRQSLKDRKRELDLQLQQLSMEDNQPEATSDDDDDSEEQEPAPAPAQQQAPVDSSRFIGTQYYTAGGLSVESLSSQMAMMQQMQDWMLKQKDSEMELLRNKVESYQKELLQKEVEIALLKERLNQQEERMQHEIKLIKLSAAAATNRRGEKGSNKKHDEKQRNIHIQELHVQVGANLNDGSKNGEVDPKAVQSATRAATAAALNKAADAAEQREKELEEMETEGSKKQILTKKDQNNTRQQKPKEYTFVPQNGNNGKLKETNSEEEEEEEGKDMFNTKKLPWEPATVVSSRQSSRKSPPPAIAADAELAPMNSLRKNPMNASVKSIQPSHQHGPAVAAAAAATPALDTTETALPSKESIELKRIPSEIEDGPATVPLTEDVTLSTIDQKFFSANNTQPSQNESFNPYPNNNQLSSNNNNDDERSILSAGNTVASSTYGEDRQKVVSRTLLDPYGDKGRYSGVVLRSTGMPHGLGRMVYEDDGRTYEGDWRHGRWHGFGRATFANGDSYEGEYRFDQRHGRGKYCWSDGRIYDGEFAEDKRHGKGTFKWPDGATYEGDFHQGQREGHGRYTFSDGGYYTGSWVDGRYEGFGECHWEDGRKYKGEWRAGMAHGQGVETYPDGRVRHDGQWIDDEPIRVNR
eukprot:CAMPEP_0194221368 /NCGR_PEP_ID=MMETSP0156-20130528/30399_1 /TAXON_ID=33649 /ORGANISM="Thalassionema nitzschioides, Strain L26-B" /LENGTH=701 /DNA_ID=CAMNT_0038951741 /DNA_START=239 /DNA_END=2344 /DNA_ORIENTATION=-